MSFSPCIQLDRVTLLRERGTRPALDGVSLSIDRGERVGLVGPSGAGKSTLLSLLNTSVAPTGGTVRLLGHNPAELHGRDRRALRAQIGTVHQDLHLAGPLRVIHNVNAGRLGEWSSLRSIASLVRPREIDRATAALESLGIADKLWRRTDELSGGERQRVGLARLIVQGAELVLADEPTASLDPARSREVLRLLTDTSDNHGCTLLVSLHAFDLAVEHFDRLIGLRSGRVLFDLPAAAVTDDHARALYDLEPSQ
jgi:phosphonate transport system ATP-binding protein